MKEVKFFERGTLLTFDPQTHQADIIRREGILTRSNSNLSEGSSSFKLDSPSKSSSNSYVTNNHL